VPRRTRPRHGPHRRCPRRPASPVGGVGFEDVVVAVLNGTNGVQHRVGEVGVCSPFVHRLPWTVPPDTGETTEAVPTEPTVSALDGRSGRPTTSANSATAARARRPTTGPTPTTSPFGPSTRAPELGPGAGADAFRSAVESHLRGEATVTASYGRARPPGTTPGSGSAVSQPPATHPGCPGGSAAGAAVSHPSPSPSAGESTSNAVESGRVGSGRAVVAFGAAPIRSRRGDRTGRFSVQWAQRVV
jgi:hypothetical protein